MKLSGRQWRLVKLQRPPPEMRIFLPQRSARSSTATLRPRLPASMAHIRPAAPPPMMSASKECAGVGSVISAVRDIEVKLRVEENETFAANYQCTGAFETVRCRAAVSEYFIYDFAGRPNRANRAKWIGEIDATRNSGRRCEAGLGRGGGA